MTPLSLAQCREVAGGVATIVPFELAGADWEWPSCAWREDYSGVIEFDMSWTSEDAQRVVQSYCQ